MSCPPGAYILLGGHKLGGLGCEKKESRFRGLDYNEEASWGGPTDRVALEEQ